MKKQILLYNIKDKKRVLDIRRVLMPLKIRIKQINDLTLDSPLDTWQILMDSNSAKISLVIFLLMMR